jgi:flagellar hook-associated protein 3 FlgL
MLNVRDLLLWAANGSNTSEDLAAIANEMGNLERTILSFANVRDEEGRYLFSGTLSDRPAITFDAATQSYGLTGNDQYRQAAVANGVLVEENVTAAQVFGGGVGMLNDLNTLVKCSPIRRWTPTTQRCRPRSAPRSTASTRPTATCSVQCRSWAGGRTP